MRACCPGNQELLRLHRQRRQAATEALQSPKVEEQPEAQSFSNLRIPSQMTAKLALSSV